MIGKVVYRPNERETRKLLREYAEDMRIVAGEKMQGARGFNDFKRSMAAISLPVVRNTHTSTLR